jgi:hypothetical protein
MGKRRDTYTRENWAKAFEFCMQQLSGVYRAEFGHPAAKAYMDACEGWSIEHMREAFRKAIQSEKFCPTVATLKAYGAGIHDEADEVVPEYVQPKYTPEERADIERMKKDLAKKFAATAWAQDLPTGGFLNLGRPTR